MSAAGSSFPTWEKVTDRASPGPPRRWARTQPPPSPRSTRRATRCRSTCRSSFGTAGVAWIGAGASFAGRAERWPVGVYGNSDP